MPVKLLDSTSLGNNGPRSVGELDDVYEEAVDNQPVFFLGRSCMTLNKVPIYK